MLNRLNSTKFCAYCFVVYEHQHSFSGPRKRKSNNQLIITVEKLSGDLLLSFFSPLNSTCCIWFWSSSTFGATSRQFLLVHCLFLVRFALNSVILRQFFDLEIR